MQMSFDQQFDQLNYKLNNAKMRRVASFERFTHEIDFVRAFIGLFPDKPEWESLVLKALEIVNDAMEAPGAFDVEAAVVKAEDTLAPIGKVAKEYTVHCCGHAHIDMNWMWNWPETVNVCHDTFLTVDKLMQEFPEFRFAQSQASTYVAMQEYCPEIFEMIKNRVKEGKWDITASMWVEGDKNIVSGESLCRHLLYTREYFKDSMGLPPEHVKIDWSPDTFGHAHTLPSILRHGGVSRYYHMRTGPGPWLYKWRSPDGSEILVYNDKDRHGYNGPIYPGVAVSMVNFVKETKLHDFLLVYGVGDHGGGPTRSDLRKFREMVNWPIFPVMKLSRVDEFFDAVEKANPDLPIIDKDLNYIFEGCYTSQSNIKYANRVSELILPEAETVALIAGVESKMPYPSDHVRKAWRWTLFNHFHDILPGSGVRATYDYAQGLFQEIQAIAGSIKTRGLRALASKVDTASAASCKPSTMGSGYGDGLGAGAGDPSIPGGITARNAGAEFAEPVIIYNPKPWKRSETVFAKIWNKQVIDDRVVVRDSYGVEKKGQVVARGNYWAHEFVTVAFKAEDVPALGYKVYAIDNSPTPVEGKGAIISNMLNEIYGIHFPVSGSSGWMENEYLKVEVDFASGAIKSLIDKETGFNYVPEGKLLGVLEAYQEKPHGMTAWIIGQTPDVEQLTSGGDLQIISHGPNRVDVRVNRKYRESTISVEMGLNAGSRMVDFKLNTRWVERGTPETGVPMLRAVFPVNITNGTATYEIPFGSQEREQAAQEVPALKWADLSGKAENGKFGITLVNDSKYGHSCNENTMRLTLIRSSYDPDPLPEVKDHEIKWAVVAHKGMCDVVAATKAGEEFNSPLAVVSATVQKGELPFEHSYAEIMTPNVFISTIKKAENSDDLIVRMFESTGKDTVAMIKLNKIVKSNAKAVEVDILERPVEKNTAKFDGETLTVSIPAYGNVTVKIG